MSKYRDKFLSAPDICFKDEKFIPIYDLHEIKSWLEEKIQSKVNLNVIFLFLEKHPVKTEVECIVSGKKNSYVFCDDIEGVKGFVIIEDYSTCQSVEVGDKIICEVIEYDTVYKNLRLKFIRKN